MFIDHPDVRVFIVMRRSLLFQILRWCTAFSVSALALIVWWVLAVIPRGLGEVSFHWLYGFLILLTLILSAVILFARAPRRMSSILARFGFIGALGAFLMTAAFVLHYTNAVWNADLVYQLTWISSLALFVLGFVAWLVGGMPPMVVLFLRRFGKTELNQTLVRAVRRQRRGMPVRVVTLDDSDFTPMSGARNQMLVGAIGTAAAIVPVAVATYFVYTNFSSLFGVAEARLYGQAMMIALAGLLLLVLLCSLPSVGFLGFAFARSWVNRRIRIMSNIDITRLTSLLARGTAWQRSRLLSAPKAMIATTSHALWRDAVMELMQAAETVILDISDLSENVEWELGQLCEKFPEKAVILVRHNADLPNERIRNLEQDLRLVSYRSYPELEKSLRGMIQK